MYGNSFYNPYMYSNFANTANIGRTAATIGKAGGIGNLFKKFSLSGFLSGASKTLNVVNQAIPIYYQVKPMISNAKTMFKVMNAVKTSDNKQSINSKTSVNNSHNYSYNKKTNSTKVDYSNDGNPTFFL